MRILPRSLDVVDHFCCQNKTRESVLERRGREIQSLHLSPAELLFCEESRGQGILEEGSEILRLDTGEEMESTVRIFAKLTLCRGCKFEFLQLLRMGKEFVAELEERRPLIWRESSETQIEPAL